MPDDNGRAPVTATGDPPGGRPGVRGVLCTPRWLLILLAAIALAVAMVFLGVWQLHRYELRSTINHRIDAHAHAAPVPVTDVLRVGRPPADSQEYRRVRMTGRYDPAHQVIARLRSVDGNVGYEVLTPLRLSDGTAVLVDRGWLPPRTSDPTSQPHVPAAPDGTVTVVGQVRLAESGDAQPQHHDGRLEVRRIHPASLTADLPYRSYGGYVTRTAQRPAAAAAFVPIPVQHQNAAMNLSYILQWWLFSGMALVGFGLLVRWEARKRAGLTGPGTAPAARGRRAGAASGDRVPDDDRVPDLPVADDDRVPEEPDDHRARPRAVAHRSADRVSGDRVSDDRVPGDRV